MRNDIIRQLDRLRKQHDELEKKHKGQETTYTYHGGFDLGYLKGKISGMENVLDSFFDNQVISNLGEEALDLARQVERLKKELAIYKEKFGEQDIGMPLTKKVYTNEKIKRWGCYCDFNVTNKIYNDCALDVNTYNDADCVFAKTYRTKADCPHWRKQ